MNIKYFFYEFKTKKINYLRIFIYNLYLNFELIFPKCFLKKNLNKYLIPIHKNLNLVHILFKYSFVFLLEFKYSSFLILMKIFLFLLFYQENFTLIVYVQLFS